jgi:SAM-dependent methyltransferase
MGIDYHGAKWIKYSLNGFEIEKLLTLGRQSIHLSKKDFFCLSGRNISASDIYAEDFLRDLTSASFIHSLDYSDYEEATIMADLNLPIPDELHDKYDVVVDGGTIEHVFNVTEALANCVRLCKKNGTIIHILPADNFNGHGFWQFSAETFLSFYSPENGFTETEMVFVPLNQKSYWYKVKPRLHGRRIHIATNYPTHIMVKTKKSFSGYGKSKILQSDYVAQWSADIYTDQMIPVSETIDAGRIRRPFALLHHYSLTRPFYNWLRRQSQGLNILNKDIEKLKIINETLNKSLET